MTRKTLTALKGSILKWDRIVRSTEARDGGTSNCPLCKLFFNGGSCLKCPVYERTHISGCDCTPYEKWDLHIENDHDSVGYPRCRVQGCPECLRIACLERDFLKSLLPKRR